MEISDRELVFDEDQIQAINHGDGPCAVFAGPGSGKTLVLTQRVFRLIREKIVEYPFNILAITFTNRATEEMESRLKKLLTRRELDRVKISTFHSFCNEILIHYGYLIGFEDFYIFDPLESKRLIDDFKKRRSPVRYRQLSEPRYENYSKWLRHQYNPRIPRIRRTYSDLNQFFKDYQAMDFAHILYYTHMLFQQEEWVLSLYQIAFPYVLIDEFQDTNEIQYKIVHQLCSESRNIFIVGDDDQQIFQFRGALNEIFSRFYLDFDSQKLIPLRYNYRSGPEIVDRAQEIREQKTEVMDKNMIPFNTERECLVFQQEPFDSIEEEIDFVIEKVRWSNEEKQIPFHEIAILTQQWKYLENYVNHLENQDLPFRFLQPTNFQNKVEFPIATIILAFLRSIQRPNSNFELRNLTLSYISNNSLSRELYESIPMQEEYTEVKEFITDMIQDELLEDIINLVEDPEEELLPKLNELIDLLQGSLNNRPKETIEDAFLDFLLEYLQERTKTTFNLGRVVSEFLLRGYHEYVEENKLNLSTYHTSKGLQFDVVFMVGCHIQRNIDDEEINKTFVAFTRARKYIFLTCVEDYPRHLEE